MPFVAQVTIRFDVPASAFPEGATAESFELTAWDGDSWSALDPTVSFLTDGSASVRERVSEFAPIYAVMYVPSRFIGTPQLGNVGLLVAVLRSEPPVLIESLLTAGCEVSTLAILRDGRWRAYVNGAPEAVNAGFPTTVRGQEAFFVRCN